MHVLNGKLVKKLGLIFIDFLLLNCYDNHDLLF